MSTPEDSFIPTTPYADVDAAYARGETHAERYEAVMRAVAAAAVELDSRPEGQAIAAHVAAMQAERSAFGDSPEEQDMAIGLDARIAALDGTRKALALNPRLRIGQPMRAVVSPDGEQPPTTVDGGWTMTGITRDGDIEATKQVAPDQPPAVMVVPFDVADRVNPF